MGRVRTGKGQGGLDPLIVKFVIDDVQKDGFYRRCVAARWRFALVCRSMTRDCSVSIFSLLLEPDDRRLAEFPMPGAIKSGVSLRRVDEGGRGQF